MNVTSLETDYGQQTLQKDVKIWSNDPNCWIDHSDFYQNFKRMKANIFCLEKPLESHFF